MHVWTKCHFVLTAFSSTGNRRWQCALLTVQHFKLNYFLLPLILHNQYDHSYSENWFAVPFVILVPRLWSMKQTQVPLSCASFRDYESFSSLNDHARVYHKFSQKSELWGLRHSRWEENWIFLPDHKAIFCKLHDPLNMCSFASILWWVQILLVCTGFFFQ